MNRLLLAIVLCLGPCLILGSRPARAEFPFAFGAGAGAGPGVGTTHGLASPGLSGLVAADLAWRDRPGHAYVIGCDFWLVGQPGGGYSPIGYVPQPRRLDFETKAVTFGIERHPAGPTSNFFIRGSIGVGRLWLDGHGSGFDSSALGLAVSAQAAFRLVAKPGPLGLLVGFRTTHILTRDGTAHALTFLLGPTIDPR